MRQHPNIIKHLNTLTNITIDSNIVKKILILEDSPDRIIKFKNMFSQNSKNFIHVDYVDTAKDAISLLEKYKYDLIFLDHDLGGKIFVNSDEENTGNTVIKQIPYTKNLSTKIIVHSHNPGGVNRMLSIKELDSVWIPFYYLNIKLI